MNEKLEEFYRSIAGRNVTVIGIGVSNAPLIRLLVQKGAIVTACDKRTAEQLGPVAKELLELGVTLHLGENYLEGLSGELIFKTPGMRFDNPALEQARARGCRVTSEMEVFFELCPCKLIAVTGSDGKSTTTTLVAKLLEAQGYTVHLGGNLGRPLLPDIESISPQDMAVLELSSFQLHTMRKSPDIAVITNLSPNHLDWHRDFDEYIAAKKRICASMPADGLLVLNYDNEHTRAFAASAGCRVRFFSRKNREAFCFIDGEGLHCGGRLLLPDGDIRLVGAHNRENYAAAYAATADLLADGALTAVARDFGGVEHRIEFVAEKNGVRYYNSSIDSSPSRTAAALRSFDGRVIVIAGGYDKKIPLDTLGAVFAEKTAGCVLMGDTAPKLLAVLAQSGYAFPVERAESMREAVAKASALAGPCGTVLLSPAAASFDTYRNFEERGNDFKAVVRAL